MHDALAALCLLAAAFCAGVGRGLVMAWTQPQRMRRWATLVEAWAARRVDLQLADDLAALPTGTAAPGDAGTSARP